MDRSRHRNGSERNQQVIQFGGSLSVATGVSHISMNASYALCIGHAATDRE